MIYFAITAVLFVFILVYFRIADRLNIIDKPNERSSHSIHTLRGAGIIFPIATVISNMVFQQPHLYLLSGILIVSIVSFTDDITNLSYKIRFPFHVLAVLLMLYQYHTVFFSIPWYWTTLTVIMVLGTMNAYNFMDGINGITGLYSLVFFATVAYYYYWKRNGVDDDYIYVMMIACVVFLYFNFRKRARCFAGDVGSVSLGFIVCALIIGMVIREHNLKYIFLLAVYGTDSVLTIVHRLILRQNIFLAHRLHFFQLLVNEKKLPHLLVSTIYALIQLGINAFILFTDLGFILTGLISCLPLALIYVISKRKMMHKHKDEVAALMSLEKQVS